MKRKAALGRPLLSILCWMQEANLIKPPQRKKLKQIWFMKWLEWGMICWPISHIRVGAWFIPYKVSRGEGLSCCNETFSKLTNRAWACTAEIISLREQPSHWHIQSRYEGNGKSLRLSASKTINHSTIEIHQISFTFIILK